MNRYARQIILPEMGEEGQRRLTRAHALAIGAGGLGAPVLQYLAGAGVGRVTVVDPDVVDLTNLHRQTIFAEAEVGRPKAEAAAGFVRRLNADIAVEAVAEALTPANVAALIGGADIVLDCADSFAASYIASDACFVDGTPLISASALRLSGYVGGFCGGAPSMRAVFPDLPNAAQNCATAGVLGPVVGAVGAMQAHMALSTLAGIEPSPLGRLVTYDAKTFAFGGFRFDGAPEPEGRRFAFIAPSAIGPDDFVAELRPAEEAPVAAATHAARLNAADFTATGPRPADGQRAVMCCRSGLRAWQAAEKGVSAHNIATAWVLGQSFPSPKMGEPFSNEYFNL